MGIYLACLKVKALGLAEPPEPPTGGVSILQVQNR
jgi:hypothetical protein